LTTLAKFLRITALALFSVLALTLVAILFYPMKASIGKVLEQPAEPLPQPFRQAWRYSISETGSSMAVYLLAAQKIVRAADYPGPSLGIRPLPIAVRLAAFAQFTQVERFAAQTHLPRCWTKGIDDLTAAEALYLAARTLGGRSEDKVRIRAYMTRIAESIIAENGDNGAAFMAAAAGPLPDCK
jgi:hypothetical protein